jgi:hypothetical protein
LTDQMACIDIPGFSFGVANSTVPGSARIAQQRGGSAGRGKVPVTTGQYGFETVFVRGFSVAGPGRRYRNFVYRRLQIASRHMVRTGPRERHRPAATTPSQTEVIQCQLLNPSLPEIGMATLC